MSNPAISLITFNEPTDIRIARRGESFPILWKSVKHITQVGGFLKIFVFESEDPVLINVDTVDGIWVEGTIYHVE